MRETTEHPTSGVQGCGEGYGEEAHEAPRPLTKHGHCVTRAVKNTVFWLSDVSSARGVTAFHVVPGSQVQFLPRAVGADTEATANAPISDHCCSQHPRARPPPRVAAHASTGLERNRVRGDRPPQGSLPPSLTPSLWLVPGDPATPLWTVHSSCDKCPETREQGPRGPRLLIPEANWM